MEKMVVRSFAGRGPTLQQLLQATAAERARKAAATAQVLGQTGSVAPINTAAANAATQQVQTQQVKQQQAQQVQQQAQLQAQKVQQAQQVQQQTQQKAAQQAASALQISRFARRNVVDPNSKWAVHGKSIDEYNAEAAQAQAAANVANAAINNSLVGGVTGNTTYYDVDSSLTEVYKQAVAAGVSVAKPTSYGKSITDAKKAQAVIDAYVAAANKAISSKYGGNAAKTTGSSTPYYDLDSSLNDIYKQASAAGVSIPKPTSYGKTITDAAKAQAIIDNYVKTANTAITAKSKADAEAASVYDVSGQYNDIYNQAKGYGVNVAKPAQTQFKTQAAAQAALDDYVGKVNKALENAPAPTYENIDPQKTSGYSYVYTMSHAQQNELIRENDYRRTRGLPEMSEYDFRKQEGVPVTTQQGGSYVKPKLNNKSYSSAASNGTIKLAKDEGQTYKTIAPIGSGDIKLANMKAASTVDAKTNKPVVISAKQAAQVKAAAVQQKQQAAVVAADAATVAKQVAKDANAEAAAKAKQVTAVRSQAKQTVNQKEKAALEKEVKVLEKEVKAAKETAKAADAHAKATEELAVATKKAATVAKSSAPTAKQSTAAVKAVEKAQAKVEKTEIAAQKTGVQDHTGQILLKDGTWIDQIQKVGATSGKGEKNVVLFGATEDYKKQLTAQYQAKLEGKSTTPTLTPSYAAALKAVQEAVLATQKVTDSKKAFAFQSNVLEINQSTGELTLKANAANYTDMQSFKSVAQLEQEVKDAAIAKKVAVALSEARKINPNGSQEYFEGVANSTRRNSMSTKEVMAEDWNRGNKQISEKLTKPAVTALRTEAGKVDAAVHEALSGVSISVNEKGKIAIDKKGKETLKNRTTFNANKVYSNAVEDSVAVQGINRFVSSELDQIANKPLNYAAETGLMVAAGGALGAGYGGAKVLLKSGGAKVASKLSGTAAKKFVEGTTAHVLDTVMVGSMVGGIAANEAAYRGAQKEKTTEAEKKEAAIEHASEYMKMGKEFALGGIGFAKGAKIGASATTKALAAGKKTATVSIPRATELGDALPSEFDVTNVAKYAPKAKVRTTAEKITTLKKQVTALKSSKKPEDIAKVKNLKKQINAFEAKNKNIAVVTENKMKNRADLKEVVEEQAFNQRLSELKEMKAVADAFDASLINKIPPTEADLAGSLKNINPSTLAKIDRMQSGWDKVKTATQLVKQNSTKMEYARDFPVVVNSIVKDLSKVAKNAEKYTVKKASSGATKINRFGKSQVSDFKKFKTTGVKTSFKQFVESEKLKEVQNKKALTEAKVHERTRAAYKIRSKARAIENGLEQARVRFDVSKEAYYTAKAAKFRLENGISTKKAAETDSINILLGKNRIPSKYNQPKVNGYTLRKTSEQAVHTHNLARLGDSAKFVKNADPAEVEALAKFLDTADFANDWMAPRKEVLARKVKDTTASDSEFDTAFAALKQAKEKAEMKEFADSWMAPKEKKINVKTISDKELEKTLLAYEKTKLSFKRDRQQKYEARRDLTKKQQKVITAKTGIETPIDITDVAAFSKSKATAQINKKQLQKKMHDELKSILRDAQALKEFKNTPTDITNLAAFRRAKATPVKLTTKDVAFFKAKNAGKFNVNKMSTEEWNSLKSQAAAYNKKVEARHKAAEVKAQKRAAKEESYKIADEAREASQSVKELTKTEKNKLTWEKAHQRILAERSKAKTVKAEARAESKKQFEDIHFEKWLENQRQKSALREAKAEKAKSPEGKAKEDRHFEAWERLQKEKSAKREKEKEYRESPEYKAKEEKHFEARERAAKRKASDIAKEKEYRESPEYKAKEEKHFEAWERAQVDKMLKRETHNKVEAQSRNLNNAFSVPEMTKAKAELISKRVAEANEYMKNVDVEKFGKNPKKEFEATKREAELEKNVKKSQEYMQNIDVTKFEKDSKKSLDAKRKDAELEKAVALSKERVQNIDVTKFEKISKKNLDSKRKEAELEKAVALSKERIQNIDVTKFEKNSKKSLDSKRKEAELEKAVALSKERMKNIDVSKFQKTDKPKLPSFGKKIERKTSTSNTTVKKAEPKKYTKDQEISSAGGQKLLLKMEAVQKEPRFKNVELLKNPEMKLKGRTTKKQLKLKNEVKLKNPALKAKRKVRKLKVQEGVKEKTQSVRIKLAERVKTKRATRSGWYALPYAGFSTHENEYESVTTLKNINEIVKDFNRFPIQFVSQPNVRTPQKINTKPTGPFHKTVPNVKNPVSINVKPVVGPSHKTLPDVKTPPRIPGTKAPTKVEVTPVVKPLEFVPVPPKIKDIIMPVIKEDIIPDVRNVVDVIPIITPVPVPETKNEHSNRVDVSGIYISDPWVYKRRKIKPMKEFKKTNSKRIHLSRDIRNRLGSLSSFFSSGSSTPTKSRKKSVKTTRGKSVSVKPKTARKQTKRG